MHRALQAPAPGAGRDTWAAPAEQAWAAGPASPGPWYVLGGAGAAICGVFGGAAGASRAGDRLRLGFMAKVQHRPGELGLGMGGGATLRGVTFITLGGMGSGGGCFSSSGGGCVSWAKRWARCAAGSGSVYFLRPRSSKGAVPKIRKLNNKAPARAKTTPWHRADGVRPDDGSWRSMLLALGRHGHVMRPGQAALVQNLDHPAGEAGLCQPRSPPRPWGRWPKALHQAPHRAQVHLPALNEDAAVHGDPHH